MNELTKQLRIVLGDTFVFSFKAQAYHWNVRGMLFDQLHAFFGVLYGAAYANIDILAEYIRIEGELAPKSLVELYAFATLKEDDFVPGTAQEMLRNLANDNAVLLSSYSTLFHVADQADAQGIADFAAAQLDILKKYQWMIKSHLEE